MRPLNNEEMSNTRAKPRRDLQIPRGKGEEHVYSSQREKGWLVKINECLKPLLNSYFVKNTLPSTKDKSRPCSQVHIFGGLVNYHLLIVFYK